jgi:lipopolysaccharide/colanic/teichoic acid biosynthesis glycosyltransferase
MTEDRGVAQPGSVPALAAGVAGRPTLAPDVASEPSPPRPHRPPLEPIEIAPTSLGYRVGKRLLDLAASGIGLIVTSPLLLGISAAVKATSPGPVLFRQERVGLGGRRFMAYKFRSMHVDADQGTHRDHIRELMQGEDEDAGTWKPIAEDPRVTRVGAFLRRSHLDELPQLVNILKGEMSLVGPRPPIPYEVELYEPWHRRRLSVVPGLTGLWQATGWGSLSFDEGVRLDLEYIERRSLWLDVRLIFQTLVQIVRGRQF